MFRLFIAFAISLCQVTIATAQVDHYYFKQVNGVTKSLKLGFGFYGLAPSGNMMEDFNSSIKSDVINTYIINSYVEEEYVTALQQANGVGAQVFIAIQGSLLTLNPNYVENSIEEKKTKWILAADWQKRFDKIVDICKKSGAYNALAGWYIDEPFCFKTGKTASGYEIPNGSITPRDFITISKYNHDKIGKRFFAIMGGVTYCLVNRSGLSPGDFATRNRWIDPFYLDTPQITPEMTKYVTDTGINNYDDEGFYDSYYNDLKIAMGSSWDRAKIWHVPGTMKFRASPKENRVIHLNKLYDMLKREKNPGGLLGYYWSMGYAPTDNDISNGDVGAKFVFDPNYNKSMFNEKLALRTAEIAREITNEKKVVIPSNEASYPIASKDSSYLSSAKRSSSLTSKNEPTDVAKKTVNNHYLVINKCDDLNSISDIGKSVVIISDDERINNKCFQFKLSPNAAKETIKVVVDVNIQEGFQSSALIFWIKTNQNNDINLTVSVSDSDYERFSSNNKGYIYLLDSDNKAKRQKFDEAISKGFEGYVLIPNESFTLNSGYQPTNNKIDSIKLIEFDFNNTGEGNSVFIDDIGTTDDSNYVIKTLSKGIERNGLIVTIIILLFFGMILGTALLFLLKKRNISRREIHVK